MNYSLEPIILSHAQLYKIFTLHSCLISLFSPFIVMFLDSSPLFLILCSTFVLSLVLLPHYFHYFHCFSLIFYYSILPSFPRSFLSFFPSPPLVYHPHCFVLLSSFLLPSSPHTCLRFFFHPSYSSVFLSSFLSLL